MSHGDNRHQNVTYGFASGPTTVQGRSTQRRYLTRDSCSTAPPEGRAPAASGEHSNHGDGLIDGDLLVLADQLEEEADVREESLKRQSEAGEMVKRCLR